VSVLSVKGLLGTSVKDIGFTANSELGFTGFILFSNYEGYQLY